MAVFFFNDTATTEIYTLSLHDALPISVVLVMGGGLGGGDLERAVALLFGANAAMHLVVLCGPNERSRERLEKLATKEGYSGRKSTRLNSSHAKISYAVFRLKTQCTTAR